MSTPKQTSRRGPHELRPWSTMAVGEQFFVSTSEARPSSIRTVAYSKGVDLDRKFSVAIADGGVTVTRTA